MIQIQQSMSYSWKIRRRLSSLEEETEREKNNTASQPRWHTAPRYYGPVPPRQHQLPPWHAQQNPGPPSMTPSHHVSATKSPPRPQQCQVYISDEEKRREIPGKARKGSHTIRNVQSIRAAQTGAAALVGGFLLCPIIPSRLSPRTRSPSKHTAEPSHPSPHASHHSSTASLPLPASPEQGGVTGGWRSTRRCAGAATAACAPSTATPSTSSSGPSRSTRKLPPCSLSTPSSSTSWDGARGLG
jgi:hypothetical protein